MTIAELRELLDAKLKGDNANFTLSKALLKEALLEVLRRTRANTHIVKEQSTIYLFKHFRKISKDYYLRYPYISLDDTAKIDMEEELCMAVAYFLCSNLSTDKGEYYKKKAQEVIDIYDTNVTFRRLSGHLNVYFGGYEWDGKDTNDDDELIPILQKIAVEVGKSKNLTINTSETELEVSSTSSNIKATISGTILTITSYGEVEKAYVIIKGKNENFKIEVYSAEADGEILD